MGSERTKRKLGELCHLITDGAHQSPKSVEAGRPMASVKDLTRFGVDSTGARHICEDDFDTLVRQGCQPQIDDILIAKDGNSALDTVCKVRQTPDYVLLSSVAIIRPNKDLLEPEYLKQYFSSSSVLTYLKDNFISGAAIPRVILKDFKQAEVPLPPLPEQKAIAHILGTLDDKIELNRRMNATLEGMAQALFKSWFVDFDPVIDNALAAGNPIPAELAPRAEVRRQALETNQTSLSAEASAKAGFPAAFQFTEELGWIPEGWAVGCISDLAALNPESWTAKKHPDSVSYVDLANTKDGRINETTSYEFGEAPSRARRVLKPHDTIIGTVRPGNRSFAYIHEDGLTGSTGFAVLRSKEAAFRSFVYLGLTRDEVIDVFAHLADGAAYPAIRPEVVGSTQIPIPDSEVLQSFEDQAAPLITKIGQHQRELDTLTKLRDTLLPNLISGELRLPETEQLAEEALL